MSVSAIWGRPPTSIFGPQYTWLRFIRGRGGMRCEPDREAERDRFPEREISCVIQRGVRGFQPAWHDPCGEWGRNRNGRFGPDTLDRIGPALVRRSGWRPVEDRQGATAAGTCQNRSCRASGGALVRKASSAARGGVSLVAARGANTRGPVHRILSCLKRPVQRDLNQSDRICTLSVISTSTPRRFSLSRSQRRSPSMRSIAIAPSRVASSEA